MTDKLLCPFCNKPLQPTLRQSDEYWCENYDCLGTNIEWVGSQKLWQELITTRKALDESEHCCTEWEKQALDYKAENIKISTALDIAVDALNKIYNENGENCINGCDGIANKALEQINEIKDK